jgi:integrase
MLTHSIEVIPSGPNPAAVYLARLAPGSRRAQAGALRTLAGMLAQGSQIAPGAFPWHRVGVAQATALRARLAASYRPATARRMLAALRGVVEESWRLGLLDGETRQRILDMPPIRGTTPARGRALRPEEVAALFKSAVSTSGRALLAVLLYGGLRRAEAAALRKSDIEQIDGALSLTVQGKGSKARKVILVGWPAGVLLQHADRYFGEDRLFPAPPTIYERLRAMCLRAGVPPVSPHDCRRTFASLSLDRGVDLATVQAAMGHADPRTTARYDRRGEDALRKAAERLVG